MGAPLLEFEGIRRVVVDVHRILYRFEGDEVQILPILHAARRVRPEDLP